MSDDVVESTVGDHHVNGIQAAVPIDVLHALGAEPGDQLHWHVENENEITATLHRDDGGESA